MWQIILKMQESSPSPLDSRDKIVQGGLFKGEKKYV